MPLNYRNKLHPSTKFEVIFINASASLGMSVSSLHSKPIAAKLMKVFYTTSNTKIKLISTSCLYLHYLLPFY